MLSQYPLLVNAVSPINTQNLQNKKTALGGLFGGGDKGSRTPDLLNAIETLYQLSYIPNK